VDPGGVRGGDCPDRPRAKLGVLADQRPIEVRREGLDAGGEVSREDQPCVAWTT
jgi:hypothetical protein